MKLLRDGRLVAFATETVYGLGADATSSAAVRRIYAAKGRPPTNPCIVHVSSEAVARRYATKWPAACAKLAEALWPGPLTLVVEKIAAIVPEATAGRGTVALRVPNHPLALALLRAFDGPIAAPSANRSGRVSPTTAEHVRRELGDRVDMVLDGGPCEVGIESTVLDLSGEQPVILRPGGVSRQRIEELIGPVDVRDAVVAADEAAASPGMAAVHYSPTAPMFRFEAGEIQKVVDWTRRHPGQRMALLVPVGRTLPPELSEGEGHLILAMPTTPTDYARMLYAALHNADVEEVLAIWAQLPPDEPAWTPVRDRMTRASNLP